ncbi:MULTISPECIES: hydrogenase nickel incorporation protein HypB [Paraburkholderia]|uniref:hydrogenase nickel incorporation protein HypB n=1 Tax=Paraburkholderia TaxID=1822464 RepID=UPI0015C5632B|nr:hydrogenase nickel incorporation protein HypB [Paraburkholderia madseniana]MCX4174845.1 hydrogenase nickel incorporation protein HypB [Paraburkholderia madseniana]MDQ6462846.1 hydrogenase nickel incorporation protein HypB [Paraburkholderia madseniana]NPT70139.1 hydrogenase nickel incorporation protein HypB [Paraburkholderia madseniana]
MCTTCGCSNTQGAAVTDLDAEEAAQAEAESQSQATREGAVVGTREPSYRRVSGNEQGHAHLHPQIHSHVHGQPHSHDSQHPHHHEHEHSHDGVLAHSHPHEHSHDGDHAHGHTHTHGHPHNHGSEHVTSITLEQDILAKNQLLAERNRGWLAGRSILALNLMSSPGAGKTTLLERTIHDLGETLPLTVIEGDQATLNDAERIRATGARVVQINTGTGCHLDAEMASRALTQLDPPMHSVVMIENVGNLVCPALFDLGEGAKVLILSVTEGEDKPIKYPHMFRACSLLLLNKIDLLPYLRFDVEQCIGYARKVNPGIEILRVSAQSGEGMDAWYAWLRAMR